jgi:hypothetical protein
MVRGQPVWGWTYRKAGFREIGVTQVHGHLVLRLDREDMPLPESAKPRSMHGTPLFDVASA